jgi:hypothetical protein
VLVTMVARHYHIGRAQLVGDVLTAIGVTNRRAEALALAAEAATGRQRVFLFERAGSRHCVEIAGAKP